MNAYREALKRTDPSLKGAPAASDLDPTEALRTFTEFYQEITPERIRRYLADVYAEDVFLADPFKTVEGLPALEAYFLRSAETFEACSFKIEDVTRDGGEFYVRWVMDLTLTRAKDAPVQALGMSHVRLNADGKVVFQQDYFDAAGAVYERLPVIGRVLRGIRNRL
jgi:hypothetical protein